MKLWNSCGSWLFISIQIMKLNQKNFKIKTNIHNSKATELFYWNNYCRWLIEYYTLNAWSRGKQLVLFSLKSWCFPWRSRGKLVRGKISQGHVTKNQPTTVLVLLSESLGIEQCWIIPLTSANKLTYFDQANMKFWIHNKMIMSWKIAIIFESYF